MKEEYLHYPANYFTATINEWKPVLTNDHLSFNPLHHVL